MSIDANVVKELREQTGAGLMDCKRALTETGGSIEKALDVLRQKGLATAAKKASREASEGLIGSYIHMDKLGVMVEINCETDFVAKTDDFRQLTKDVAMHIAAANPPYLKREDIPADVIAKEKEIYASQITGKPAQIVEKIVEGKLEKFYSDTCLMEQVFVKDPEQKKKVKEIVLEKVAKLGENIVIKRFTRFQLGEKC
ncbi:MAG: translation elongation factor Ts [Nitrospirae bacterium]|nr:translation elongation factor Ts [Nitrospirota bacterium]